ncbi:MAG: type III pantothenate kinase [Solirubrobacterales bacterium]|nr:type III pantothenate kinase [Solirubrobacterales bacterium]
MLLAVDVGNTQTHVGAFDGADLVADWRLATRGDSTADEIALALAGSLEFRDLKWPDIKGAIVSTVVPRLGPEYERLCERHLSSPCLLVGPAVKTGMPILIDNPRELGSDRLVNAVAAYDHIGGCCLAVDFGTSINFDAVSAQGEYLGGAIGPGLEVSIEALAGRAAKLPRIEVREPGAAIGRNTQAALQSGFIFGFAGLVDGIARRMLAELGQPATVIATGGMANSLAPLCETIDEVDSYLTLKGLRLVHERN